MSPTLDAFLRSWPSDPVLVAALLLPALIFGRGWRTLRRRDPRRWDFGKLAAFLGGLAAIFLALGSPLEPFSALLFYVHMIQHLLLMMVAPPLFWLGAPLFPMIRGLPRPVRVYWVAPLLRSRRLRGFFERLTHPTWALPLFVGVTWIWHVPIVYEVALRSGGWHYLQHACFLGAALLFWYPVVRPFPGRPRWSTWLLFPYLILADVQNTVLSALLTFSDKVLYPHYTQVPRLGGLSALDDQSVAGVLMWVPGSLVFLLPLFAIAIRLLGGGATSAEVRSGPSPSSQPLSPRERVPGGRVRVLDFEKETALELHSPGVSNRKSVPKAPGHPTSPEFSDEIGTFDTRKPARSSPDVVLISLSRAGSFSKPEPLTRPPGTLSRGERALGLPILDELPPRSRFDLTRAPLLGRFLRWRHARLALQLPLLILSGFLIFDGLRGPQVAPMNLAGVLPWIHWRGLVILGLLAAGNVFCMACPFLLPRALARRFLPAGRTWPRWLRSKWLAVSLLVLFLWAYEAFSLWDRPYWTAWIAVGYFASAFVIDGLFRGGSFCKYVCPIGQFHFVQSLASPLEVEVRDPDVCASCRTKDCIRGRDGIPGCELGLFLPRKSGNMDCTFCLDCVHSCPHENVGISAGPPGRGLWDDPIRSGVGRFGKRPDLAALVLVLVFGAFANAAGMVGPVVEWQDRLRTLLGWRSPLPVTSGYYLLTLLVLPALTCGIAAALGRRWGRLDASWLEVATRNAFALVPLGFAMWLSHYSFHFLTSYQTVVPTTQRFVADLGWTALGVPEWGRACCRPVAEWLPRLEILVLDAGMLGSLYTGYRVALTQSPRPSLALKAFAPWAVLTVLLFVAGVWIVLQPMQMRGTMPGAG